MNEDNNIYMYIFCANSPSLCIVFQQAIEQAHRLNLLNILSSAQIDPVHPCLVISVSRNNIVHDTIIALASHGSHDLKKPLKVCLIRLLLKCYSSTSLRKCFWFIANSVTIHLALISGRLGLEEGLS